MKARNARTGEVTDVTKCPDTAKPCILCGEDTFNRGIFFPPSIFDVPVACFNLPEPGKTRGIMYALCEQCGFNEEKCLLVEKTIERMGR